jgi:hypothetical protein
MFQKGDASRVMPWKNAGLLAAVSVIGDFGNLILFGIWDLGFGISCAAPAHLSGRGPT